MQNLCWPIQQQQSKVDAAEVLSLLESGSEAQKTVHIYLGRSAAFTGVLRAGDVCSLDGGSL